MKKHTKTGIVRFNFDKSPPQHPKDMIMEDLAGGSLPLTSDQVSFQDSPQNIQESKIRSQMGRNQNIMNAQVESNRGSMLSNHNNNNNNIKSLLQENGRASPKQPNTQFNDNRHQQQQQELFQEQEQYQQQTKKRQLEQNSQATLTVDLYCQQCEKPAQIACECQQAFYCSQQHQDLHFQRQHQFQCKILKHTIENTKERSDSKIKREGKRPPPIITTTSANLQVQKPNDVFTPKKKSQIIQIQWRMNDFRKFRERVINGLVRNKQDLKNGVKFVYAKHQRQLQNLKPQTPISMRQLYQILTDLVLFVKVRIIYDQVFDDECENALSHLKRILTTCIRFSSKIIKKEQQLNSSLQAAKTIKLLSAQGSDTNNNITSQLIRGPQSSSQKTGRTAAMSKHYSGQNIAPSSLDLKWIFSIIGYVANIFNMIHGGFKDAQDMYVFYGKSVQKIFGSQSLQASNVYYLIGLFYFQRKLLIKSRAAFDKALYLRKQSLGIDNPSSAQCLYNIALISRMQNNREEAMQLFGQVLQIYEKKVGEKSLECAKALEQLGRMKLEDDDIEGSYTLLKQCHSIRLQLIRDNNTVELKRISALLFILREKVKESLGNQNQNNYSFSSYQFDGGSQDNMGGVDSFSKTSDYFDEDDDIESQMKSQWNAEESSTSYNQKITSYLSQQHDFPQSSSINKKQGQGKKNYGKKEINKSVQWKGKSPQKKKFGKEHGVKRITPQIQPKSVAESINFQDISDKKTSLARTKGTTAMSKEEYEQEENNTRTFNTANWNTIERIQSKEHQSIQLKSVSSQAPKPKEYIAQKTKPNINWDEKEQLYQLRGPFYQTQSQQSVSESQQDSSLFMNDSQKKNAQQTIRKGLFDVVQLTQQSEITTQIPDILTLFLSLADAQLDIFNKTQIDFKPNRPLLISQSFQNTLAQLQIQIIERFNLSKIPRYYLLKKPDQKVSLDNLKFLQIAEQNQEKQELIHLLLSSKQMMNILKEPQKIILRTCIRYGFSLDYFTLNIRPYQMKQFQDQLSMQINQIQGAYSMKKSVQEGQGYFKKPPPNMRIGDSIFQSLQNARSEILKSIQNLSASQIFQKLDLNFAEKLATNFTIEELTLVSKLRNLVNNPSQVTEDSKGILVYLVNEFDLKELYELILYNQFLNTTDNQDFQAFEASREQVKIINNIINDFRGGDQLRAAKQSSFNRRY